jgi:flagellar protein FliO/FliZ
MMSTRAPAFLSANTVAASALLASMLVLPLAAAAEQPASTAAPAASTPPAPAFAPAPTSAPTSAPAADTPVAERATTVGELPAVAGATPSPAPSVATMPAAPAAIPNTPANPVRLPQAAPGPSAGSLVQTIFALVLVLALLAALAWAAKRYGPRVAGNSANLRMIGALNIGGRERIMVIEVGDQWIVVGASPGRVNALATMPRGDAGANASATLAGHTPSASNFSDWLKQTIDKRNAK